MLAPVRLHPLDVRRCRDGGRRARCRPRSDPRPSREPSDVVARLLERELVDLLVLVALVADVDEDLLEAGVEQRVAPALVEQRTVRRHRHLEPGIADLAHAVGCVPVQQWLTEPAQADPHRGVEQLRARPPGTRRPAASDWSNTSGDISPSCGVWSRGQKWHLALHRFVSSMSTDNSIPTPSAPGSTRRDDSTTGAR